MKKYSSSKIDAANYCVMKYFLKYCDENKIIKPLRLSAYAKGGLLHKVIEEFWVKLGTEEEAAKRQKTKKAYFDSESFADYVKRRWNQLIYADAALRDELKAATEKKAREKIQGRLIHWKNEEEKWAIKSSLNKISKPLFDELQKEGPPLYSELPFDFILLGKRFTGRIDEIRIRDNKVVIRDYKSGKPWIGNMKLNHDPQMTIYNTGLCSLCCDDEEFARTLHLEKESKKFMGNPIYVNEDFCHEFFMIEALPITTKAEDEKIYWEKNIKLIHQTTRTDNHFFEVIRMIDGVEKSISIGNVYPERGRKCDDCDERFACEETLKLAGQNITKDSRGQGFFSFAAPLYMKPVLRNEETKRFKWKKRKQVAS